MQSNEIAAGKISDLQNGEMKEIQSGDTKIVLAKVNDQLYAVSGICPHLKAPLAKGALCGSRLYCPWHHSSFDITTGHLCDPPAINHLPRYSVRIDGEAVYINLQATAPYTSVTEEILPQKTFVIIGGGAAGSIAAKTLRENGFAGRLVMITKEPTLPYDRTMLSKKYLSGKAEKEDLELEKKSFYTDHQIETVTSKQVKKLLVDLNEITFTDGSTLHYNRALIATGGEPNKLDIKGADFINVFTLRTEADAANILKKAKASRKVCIIGASFIAMETAASLKTLGLEVTVLAKEEIPFEKNFGKEIGRLFLKMHEEKGVVVKIHAEVAAIQGTQLAEAVLLKTGESIPTDLVVVGIGVHPVTDFIEGLSLSNKDKSILVDEYLQAGENVYAAGDIATYTDEKTNEPIRIEHWRLAQQHGQIAAENMLGKQRSVNSIVPFFWTNQFDKRLSYVGHAKEWDEVIIDGDVEAQKFLAFYIKAGKVHAVASMGRDVESDQIEDAMRNSTTLFHLEELKAKLVV